MENVYDAPIVGGGPKGLTAANVLAVAGLPVIVLEVGDRVGGSCRTEALTLPGLAHDVCSCGLGIGQVFLTRILEPRLWIATHRAGIMAR